MGSTVVNHMQYADDVVLFAPSAKGLQKRLDLSHTYGCNHDIEFNPSKSCAMYIDSRKAGNTQTMTIGGKMLLPLSHTFDILYVAIYPMTLI